MVQPRHSMADFAARGDAIYERKVEPLLTPEDAGKFVAIDIESGTYEIGPDELTASDRLLARRPQAQVCLRRAGSRYAHRFGPRARFLSA
jgi:hypothetical protein